MVLEHLPSANAGPLLVLLSLTVSSSLASMVIVLTHAPEENRTHREAQSLEMGNVAPPFPSKRRSRRPQFEN